MSLVDLPEVLHILFSKSFLSNKRKHQKSLASNAHFFPRSLKTYGALFLIRIEEIPGVTSQNVPAEYIIQNTTLEQMLLLPTT